MVDLVVAHYLEDLDWLRDVAGDPLIYLYHKGGYCDPAEYLPRAGVAEKMPNTGREAGTYLYHIIRHYDELRDVSIFLQGNPAGHIRPFREVLNYAAEECRDRGGFWDMNAPHATDDSDGRPNHRGGLPVGELYFRAFNRHGPPSYDFGAGACFCVSRERIQSKPRGFYTRLLDICERDFSAVYPWAMERLWPRLFLDPI